MDRRNVLIRTGAGLLGALAGTAGPKQITSAEANPAGTPAVDEVYRGRRISILRPPTGTRALGTGLGMGSAGSGVPPVLIDADPLHVMANADGTYCSVLNHFQKFDSLVSVARAAVDALAGARLVPVPAGGQPAIGRSAGGYRRAGGHGYRPALPRLGFAATSRVRHNQSALTADQRAAFVHAVLAVKKSGQYDDLVRTHNTFATQDAGGGEAREAHRCPSFLPWHRRLLLDFEDALRAVDPTVTVPYWDWTADQSPNAAPWTDDLLGRTGRPGDHQVVTGPFAYRTGNWTLSVRLDSRPYLTRTLGAAPVGRTLPSAASVAQLLRTTPYDTAPWNDNATTAGFRNLMEGWPGGRRPLLHNQVHTWIGGSMNTTASPNDPVFWLHHCNIDRLWAQWQALHPDQGYLPDTPAPRVVDIDQPMRPWGDVTPRDMLDSTRFYTYA